jgi:hypothetical protein
LAGNQAFTLDTDGIVAAGEIHQVDLGAILGPTYNGFIGLELYIDGDTTPDMQIIVQKSTPLVASDFIL